MLSSLVLENVCEPISVTDSGISMDSNLLQSLNAPPPISVTVSGILTVVKPLHPDKM
jgi:hypothetical protein